MSSFRPFTPMFPTVQSHLAVRPDRFGNPHLHEVIHYLIPGQQFEINRYFIATTPGFIHDAPKEK